MSRVRPLRRASHAYLWLVANPYPGFVGEEGEYPIDVRLPPPERAAALEDAAPDLPRAPGARCSPRRSAAPAACASGSEAARAGPYGYSASGLGSAVGVLGWFAILARGRMPKGLRDAGAYSVGYNAQALAYAAAR